MPPTTRSSSRRAAAVTTPAVMAASSRAAAANAPSQTSVISSSQLITDPSRRILAETTRQAAGCPSRTPNSTLNPFSWTNSAWSVNDISDSKKRVQVNALQSLHPWASTKLCYSMLESCGSFEDANAGLQDFVASDSDIDDEEGPFVSSPQNTTGFLARSATNRMSRNEFDASISPADKVSNFYKPQIPSFSNISSFIFNLLPVPQHFVSARQRSLALTAPTFNKEENQVAGSHTGQRQMPLVLTNPTEIPASAIFSREERQRAVSSSMETAQDRRRLEFTAGAVLYRAFSSEQKCGDHYHLYIRHSFKLFGTSSGIFPYQPNPVELSKVDYKGTNRARFQPLSRNSTSGGQVVLQSINLKLPYVNVSLEELRLGDWIRCRRKAPHLFSLFRKLPAEIRCMIWRYAMPPRVIELRYNYNVTKCWTLCKVPMTLHVCQESRYEALKEYTLAFGVMETPDKTYFSFRQDTLFLTYEKWHDDGEYEEELSSLTYYFGQSGEAKKIRSLAVDADLLHIWARRLQDEEEEWEDMGEEAIPLPELDVLPEYKSLQRLAIVKTQIDGFWNHDELGCDCEPNIECDFKKRMDKNDKAEFVLVNQYCVADSTKHEYHKELLSNIKLLHPEWSLPEIEYMVKRASQQNRKS